MKRHVLPLVTCLTLLLTGTVLKETGATSSHPRRAALPRAAAGGQAKLADPFDSPVARRWREGQPGHWRALLLQQ